MAAIPEAAGLFAILGALGEAGALTEDDDRRCRERLVRLTGAAQISLSADELAGCFSDALDEARAVAVRVSDFTASAAYVEPAPSHPPTKRARMAGLNSGFS